MNYPDDVSPEVKLWRAVIATAFHDAKYDPKKLDKKGNFKSLDIRNAARWLGGHSPHDFNRVCTYALVDPGWLKMKIKQMHYNEEIFVEY